MKSALGVLGLLATAAAALAAEGKWTPPQVLELDPAWLRQQGLELPSGRLWDAERGTGLLAGTINVGGCSGGFISADGLFITNHHCLFGILQEHATAANDLVANGFLARARGKELRSKTARLTLPRRFVDVTAEVLAAVPANAGDAQRWHALQRRQQEILARCERQPATRCKIAPHEGGLQYVLQEMAELDDVRLVYAPARAVGEYGGEVDNWSWPRHTGDFSIGRAYLHGQPYRPEFYFPLAAAGVRPDQFVMILGYPGTTYRALTAGEMSERFEFFALRRKVYGAWIELLEQSTAGSAAGAIAAAENLKTLRNRSKNAEGQLAALERGRILEKQASHEQAVLTAAPAAPAAAHRELALMAAEQQRSAERDFLLAHAYATEVTPAPLGPKALVLATTVVRAAIERAKADADRDPLHMERNLERVRDRLEREQKNYFEPADRALLEDFAERAQQLPADSRIPALDRALGGAAIGAAYAGTRLFDLAERLRMFSESPAQLRARRDPLLDLAFELEPELRALDERRARWDGMVSRLRPVWRSAVIAQAGKPVAPDANNTLRVSFAHVRGYRPHDGVWMLPRTTLGGAVAKHTGREPFALPAPVLRAASERRLGRWKDAELEDVPVAFLADGDTTGGSSGSPVVNGRGELVGVNFDRVWENVANDFGYNPEVARNISVDVRYLLWMLDQVEHADELLLELGVQR